jgi:hypothetical protein
VDPWTDTPRVKTWLKLPDDADNDVVGQAVAAVNAWVSDLPHVPVYVPPPADPVEPDPLAGWRLGATMLAARYHRRRNSAGGVESVTDAGAVYVPRRDSDVDRLLRIGTHAPPRLG